MEEQHAAARNLPFLWLSANLSHPTQARIEITSRRLDIEEGESIVFLWTGIGPLSMKVLMIGLVA